MSGASPAPPGLAPMYGAPQTPTPVAVPQVNFHRGVIHCTTNLAHSGGMYRDLILRGGPPSQTNLRLRCSPTCGAATSTATTPCSSHAWTSSGELSILFVVSHFLCRIIYLAHQVQQPQPQQQQQHFQGYQQQPMYHQQGAQYHNPPAPQYHQMVSSQLMDEISQFLVPSFTLLTSFPQPGPGPVVHVQFTQQHPQPQPQQQPYMQQVKYKEKQQTEYDI